jgi:hypothetical protein
MMAAPPSASTATPAGLMVSLPSDGGGGNNLALSPAERRLFCSHSVAALKQIAEDKRNASEDKKEELRQLVGSANTHKRTHMRDHCVCDDCPFYVASLASVL